jgi:vacuolar-type H+-ATPase subunit I/STV1
MSQRKATREAVYAACELIASQGGYPSKDSVIKQIGGGSPNTVLPLINQWKQEPGNLEKVRISEKDIRPLPKDLQKKVDRVYTIMLKEAEDTILDESTRKLEAEIGMLTSLLSEAEKENIRLKTIEEFYNRSIQENRALLVENEKLKHRIRQLEQTAEVSS